MAITVESASTHCLYRAVTNLNSRAVCGRSLDNESTKLSNFKLGLETEMERINSSYKGIYAERPWKEPTAKEYTSLYLIDDLVWENAIDAQGKEWRLFRAAPAPTRDYFLSAASSVIYNLREVVVDLRCDTMVGLILIAMYMCSFQQLYAILSTIKGDPELIKRIQTDLPGTY